jgi:hypothetical protein
MSQLTHPRTPLGAQIRALRPTALAAVLAGMAVLLVLVLVLAIGDKPSTTDSADRSQPAVRVDGGPEETGVAAAIAPKPAVASPDESRIAADLTFPGLARDARAAGEPASSRPDESAVAAAISGR